MDDVLGRFFAIMADRRGEYISIRYALTPAGKKNLSWTTFSHSNVDGIAGLHEFLTLQGFHVEYDGTQPVHKPRHIFRRLRLIFSALSDKGPYNFPETARFRGISEKFSGDHTPMAGAHLVFSEAETRRITANASSLKVSVNSYLLAAINNVVQNAMTTGDGPLVWFIPVDLRPWLPGQHRAGNVVSNLFVPLAADATAPRVHEGIRGQLTKGMHWHSWDKLRLASKLGIFALIAKRPRKTEFNLHNGKKLCFIFSNLGKWRSVQIGTHGTAAPPVLFCPPPLISAPASIGAVTVNGRLTLTLQVHPAIKANSAELRRHLHEIRRRLKADNQAAHFR